MTDNGERGGLRTDLTSAPACSADVLSSFQSLLATLEDIDSSYDSDIETVRTSGVPEAIKQDVVRTLQQRHEERRAPYVRRLSALRKRITSAMPHHP